jgi:SAM-dependent methyltransferase
VVTAVRDIEGQEDQWSRMHSLEHVTYRDGAEERVFDIISAAKDISSTSDELADQAATWAERYHLSTARANVLRGFRFSPGTVALEIGAGCGAITRYLGEQCAQVDALEPVLSRARAARERVRDLDHVKVFVGSLPDIPALPTYDLVVVVGVLEYIGGGAADLEAQRAFLHQVQEVLRPGGTMILAIENKLGVKYLAGAGEDHTGRVYDSVEGYPAGTIARTFSRAELDVLLCGAGLAPQFFSAFPDYKLPRALLADQLYGTVPALAWRIPQFPSPDRVGRWSKAMNEERLWRSLVQDGVGGNFGNSFVVAATKPGPSRAPADTELWPTEQLAAFYQPDRRVKYATETRVLLRDGDVVFQRRPLRHSSDAGTPSTPPPASENSLVHGRDLLELMEEADDQELVLLLKQWVEVADRVAGNSETYQADLLPHNLVRSEEGNLWVIDEEPSPWPFTRPEALARGALITTWKLACRTPPSRWPGPTFGDAVLHLGELLGLEAADGWLDTAVDIEARLQTEMLVRTGWDMRAPSQEESIRRGLRATLAMPLTELPLGNRDHEELALHRQWLDQALEAHALALQAIQSAEFGCETAVAQRDAALTTLRNVQTSHSWRLTEPIRRLAGASSRLRARAAGQAR